MSSAYFEKSKQAQSYARCRPQVPDEVFSHLAQLCKKYGTGNCRLAVDLACGSGQATIPLAKYFNKVVGLDISREQLSNAPENRPENVALRQGRAEDLSKFKPDSVDLVTVVAGLHWFDIPKALEEVKRVLRPGGVFTAVNYDQGALDNAEADQIWKEFTNETLKDYWPVETRVGKKFYVGVDFPFSDVRRETHRRLSQTVTLAALGGYVRSLSAYNVYMEKHAEGGDIAEDLLKRLREAYGKQDSEETDDEILLKQTRVLAVITCVKQS